LPLRSCVVTKKQVVEDIGVAGLIRAKGLSVSRRNRVGWLFIPEGI